MFNLASQDSMNGAKRGRIDREVSCSDWIGHSFYTETKQAKVSDDRTNRVNAMSCRVTHGQEDKLPRAMPSYLDPVAMAHCLCKEE